MDLTLAQLDKVFLDYIKECESKADTSLKRGKYIMYGYWKAIAIHLRKLHRQIRTSLVCESVGFPTRHDRRRIREAEDDAKS